ncbi:hypothetical protein LGT41_0013710 [Abyssibius alkaniclasticus]|uniref:hypothetical protein n=1 Tax=Abyssibius alkaniclasticus TaxID=2881234 RepID=UPI00236367CF|nr:hypothetical protein [Abyssibius alkaniclasticus]UPH70830.1 hypothetical protein LGT41_0013710 [Abyssibius alkaniclasticus]|tara:strand:- start:127 stop:462 length:336 start_codon:yes stop_codon:yes gene_type:complete
MYKFALAALAAVTLSACADETTSYTAVSANRVMDIVNNTNMTMTHFYASNTSQSTYADQLGSSVLPAGRYITINFDDGTGACWFDFKARFSSGQELSARVNVCVESRWVYS